MRPSIRVRLLVIAFLITTAGSSFSAGPKPAQRAPLHHATLAELLTAIREKAQSLEGSCGMRTGFQTFTTNFKLAPESVRYSDYVVVRLLFEAARDAGFWNLHWEITNMPPNSANIWRQWRALETPSTLAPTATAECDELSALYAFLTRRAGIRGVGLLWPAPNHTVAVWVLEPAKGHPVRVVVPTTQIFLEQTDFFGTRKFDPWRQKNIYEYNRRDVPDSFELSAPLVDFLVLQMDRYGGASDLTLQQLRYLREGVFRKYWTPEDAAQYALKLESALGSGPAEDLAAYQNFARDMHPRAPQ